jgi:hypothetical protein
MSYESVISHQPRAPFRMIRHDYVNICSEAPDAVCAALLLDLAEAWTNHVLNENEKESLEDVEIQSDLWFYRSEEKIKADLFNAYGINKLRDNRQWLVEKGLLECRQITRKQGGFTNEYRLNIEALQALINSLAPVKNNERSKAKHTLKTTDAHVKNNDIREVVKETKEIDSSLQSMIAAVKKELKQYGKTAEKIAKLLLCRHTGKDSELNLEKPISPEQLTQFGLYWDKKLDRNGQKLSRPKNIDSVKSNVEAWLDTLNQPPQTAKFAPPANYTSPRPVPALVAPQTTVSDTQQADALAILQAARNGALSHVSA